MMTAGKQKMQPSKPCIMLQPRKQLSLQLQMPGGCCIRLYNYQMAIILLWPKTRGPVLALDLFMLVSAKPENLCRQQYQLLHNEWVGNGLALLGWGLENHQLSPQNWNQLGSNFPTSNWLSEDFDVQCQLTSGEVSWELSWEIHRKNKAGLIMILHFRSSIIS